MESLVKRLFANDCVGEVFVDIGFVNDFHPHPRRVVIKSSEWVFVEIDDKKSNASSNVSTYKKMRADLVVHAGLCTLPNMWLSNPQATPILCWSSLSSPALQWFCKYPAFCCSVVRGKGWELGAWFSEPPKKRSAARSPSGTCYLGGRSVGGQSRVNRTTKCD